jgi:hypothetical protein
LLVGERFVWAHLPKAGGDATAAMFRLFPHLIVHADDAGTNDKHVSFTAHAEALKGKLLVMNIRRLPSWVISYGHHIARAGLFPDYVPLPMPSREEMVESVVPDTTLNHFLQDGRFHIDRWIRQEHLREDFLRFVAEMTDVLPSHRQTLGAFPRVNAMDYDHEVSRWLSPSDVKALYRRNPLWAACEQEAYAGWRRVLRRWF